MEEQVQPLLGTITKTLSLAPYDGVLSIEAVYDEIGLKKPARFINEGLGLTNFVAVYLVEFCRVPYLYEILDWGEANEMEPMGEVHFHGIELQYRGELNQGKIEDLGRLRRDVLNLYGRRCWDKIRKSSIVCSQWPCRFGFIDKQVENVKSRILILDRIG